MSNEESVPEGEIEEPLEFHIHEMVKRILVVVGIGSVVTIAAFPFVEVAIEYLWQSHIPNPEDNRPRLYSPLALILTRIKLAAIAGILIVIPVLIHQSYLFMSPGLFKRERQYFIASIPLSALLGLAGVTFGHFITLPILFFYFTQYTEGVAVLAFGIQETIGLMTVILAHMAIVFQMPILITLVVVSGITTREWLLNKRIIFWSLFFTLGFLSSPDITGMVPVIIGVTMLVFFELTLYILKWLPYKQKRRRR